MTVAASGPTYVQTPGNGVATTFAFPFKIFAATDVVVGFIVAGVYTQQTTGFSVSGVDNNGGGSVTFTTAPSAGTTVDLRSLVPETQPTEFANFGAYLPENTTDAVDRVARLVQDLARQTYLFGIHGPDSEATAWPALPSAASRAGAFLAFDSNGLPTAAQPLSSGVITQQQFNALLAGSPAQPQGTYEAAFNYGNIQMIGPGGALMASDQLGFGTLVPNPSGIPTAFLLLGSGGGAGTAVQAWIGTDQAYDSFTPGNTLGITAGETQGSGSANGGQLLIYGGGSYGGTGGSVLVQGGTSAFGPGGATTVAGGNATNATSPLAIPGDLYLIGGQVGYQGANVHLIATQLNGKAGVVRHRVNSNITLDEVLVGNPAPGSMALYIYGGNGIGTNGYGTAGAPLISGGSAAGISWGNALFSGTMNFGSGHSATVVCGLITDYS